MQNPQEHGKPAGASGTQQIKDHEVSDPAARAVSLVTTDPAEFELALRPWELMCRPLTGGDFRHTITGVKTAEFTIYRERFSVPVDVQGVSPNDTFVIGAPIYTGREAQYWGTPYSGSTMPSSLPGPLDVKLDTGHYHQVAIIDLRFLRVQLSEEVFESLYSAMRSRFLLVPPKVLKDYTDWGGRLLNLAAKYPSLIEHESIVRTLRQDLLQHISLIAAPTLLMPNSKDYSARQQGLLKALDYMRSDFESQFSMAEISQVCGISERSLQYAFQETFGTTPHRYMKRRRLHAVRQALITSRQNGNNVSQVATNYGFYELGRFSVEYRQLFGESPSTTMKQAEI